MPSERNAGFQSIQGTYVALAAICTLALALLTSIWESDVSGSTALLGLISIYLSSPELLLLYIVFSPFSTVVDCIRLGMKGHPVDGRAWLIFFSVVEMVCKLLGSLFAWLLYRNVSSGGGGSTPQQHHSNDSYQPAPEYSGYAPPMQQQAYVAPFPLPTSTTSNA